MDYIISRFNHRAERFKVVCNGNRRGFRQLLVFIIVVENILRFDFIHILIRFSAYGDIERNYGKIVFGNKLRREIGGAVNEYSYGSHQW